MIKIKLTKTQLDKIKDTVEIPRKSIRDVFDDVYHALGEDYYFLKQMKGNNSYSIINHIWNFIR